MRITITTQVFPPEAHPTAVMVEQLSKHLVSRGHEVVVAAGFPHHPGGRLLGGYRRQLLKREQRDGVTVVRGWHFMSQSRGIAARAGVMLSQTLGTALASHIVGARPDVVLSFGPPLVGPLLTLMLARRHGARQVTVIYDLYPDVAIETGKVRNGAVVALARWMERRIYAWSDWIVVLSQGFKKTLGSKGVPADKVAVVPVWLQPGEIRPSPRDNRWRQEMGISPTTFVVLYAGTVGIVSGAEVIIDAADRLRAEPGVLFLFVGEGHLKGELEADAARRGLENVRFLPLQDRARLNDVQATADISTVTLAPGRGRTSVPSKVIGYLAAGRPVIASVDEDSDTAACVHSSRCGIVVAPGDAASIANAILELKRDGSRRVVMGRNARDAFEREYAAPAVLDRFAVLLEEIGANRG